MDAAPAPLAGKLATAPRVVVVSDLDNTMVDHSDPSQSRLKQFNELWTSKFADSLLIFSTGRSPTLYNKLRDEVPLLVPDITVCSVGTEILYGGSETPDAGWVAKLNVGWDRNAVVDEASRFPELRQQQESEQRPHKVSFNIDPAQAAAVLPALEAGIKGRGVDAVLVYSGKWDLDVMPAAAGKGKALAFILAQLEAAGLAPTQGVLVCGDSGNDADLFVTPGVCGVVVGNSHQELIDFVASHPDIRVHRAQDRCAGGIVEALRAFSFVP